MSDAPRLPQDTIPTDLADRIDRICDRFESACRAAPGPQQWPRIEDHLGDGPAAERDLLLRELILLEMHYRRRQGEDPRPEEYRVRFSSFDRAWLDKTFVLSLVPQQERAKEAMTAPPTLAPSTKRIRCPHCHNPIDLGETTSDDVLCPACGSTFRVHDTALTDTTSPMRQLGKFQLLQRVGLGAFGAVWKARDTELDRIVALKLPHASLLSSKEGAERFYREARAAAQLRHPGIVSIHEVATLEDLPALVSDFIEGVTLRDFLQVRRLTFREAAQLVADIASALDYAHRMGPQGVIHRDIKPSNIMLEAGGVVSGRVVSGEADHSLLTTHHSPKLMDFGLALREEAEITLTVDGQIIGTPAYMSPEQARGQGHAADGRSDIYSLGVVLYELLCGELPFRGSKMMIIHQVVRDDPKPPRSLNDKIPRDLETICLKAMAKEPPRRYATARELADDLGRFLAGEPIRARRVGRVEKAVKWVRRRPVIAGLIAAIVVIALIGLIGWVKAYDNAIRGLAQARKESVDATEAANKAKQEEDKAKQEEDKAKEVANKAKQEEDKAKRTLANTRYALAEAAWDRAHASEAIRQLDEVPADLRAWEWHYCKRKYEGSLFTLRGHTGRVLSVALSPDGRRLASASGDGTVKLWDAATGQEIATLRGHTDEVWSVAFSPDGRRLASASHDQTVKLWDTEQLRAGGLTPPVATLHGHTDKVYSVAFSPDGRRLASASWDHTVKLWDIDHLRAGGLTPPVATLPGHKDGVRSVAFSPDGRRLASASWDQTVKLWDVSDEASRGRQPPEIATLRHAERVHSVAFSPDGRRLASASHDRTVKLWDAATGQETATFRGHTSVVLSVAFSPDGRRLASASWDQTVKLWDAEQLRAGGLTPPVATLRGHTGTVWSVAFSPDGRHLASASHDRTVKLWDAATGQETVTLRGHTGQVWSVAFHPDGRRLASASSDQTVKLWDAAKGEETAALPGHTGQVWSVAFSPDGRLLASASSDETVKLWNAATGKETATLRVDTGQVWIVAFSPDGRRLAGASADGTVKLWDIDELRAGGPDSPLATLRGHTGEVMSVAFSPDGRLLASASVDQTVKLWDVATGEEKATLRGHADFVYSVAFSPDGRRLASVSFDQTVKLWDAATGQETATLRGHTFIVTSVAFSQDGRRLASASEDGTVKLWDAAPAQETATLRGHTDDVRSVAFSPDGRRLASASWDETKLWDTATSKEIATLRGHRGAVWSMAFSSDNQRLASASDDWTVKLWDAATGQETATLRGHTGEVWGVAFSSDGRRLASASEDGTVKLWDAATGQETTTLEHTSTVWSVAFSPDGRRVVSRDLEGKVIVWDVESRKALPDAKEQVPDPDQARHGHTFAQIDGPVIRLIDLHVSDETKAERRWLTRRRPAWHLEEADKCAKEHNFFAAAFHYEQVINAGPPTRELLDRIAKARAMIPERLAMPREHGK